MEFIDIYLFDPTKSNTNKYVIETENKIINNLKTIKFIGKEEYIVYNYKNMYLSVDNITKNKLCYNVESNKYTYLLLESHFIF